MQRDLARTVQSVLFVSAINTLVQTYFGSRLPVVMGQSFYFLPMLLAIINRGGIIDIPDPHEVLCSLLWFTLELLLSRSFLFTLACRCIRRLGIVRTMFSHSPDIAEIFEGDASHARGFHCWISLEYHSWFQWSVGNHHEVLF